MPTTHELRILSPEGDVRSIWDVNNPDEVAAAEAQFDALKKKGYLAFRVRERGQKGEIMDRFDPEAEKVILTPPLKGGL